MAAAALTKEMRPKGKVRPLFAELAKQNGAYIVFSTDDVANTGYQKRLAAMTEALADVPNGERVHLDFLGADRIARWVNQHPGITLDVLEAAGRSVRGWRPYGGWSTANQETTAYLHDESSRARVGGNAVEIIAAITAMRRELSVAGGAVRLVGISGMGKTRLAEALFDRALDPATAIAPSRAIYGDSGTELGVGSALLAEQLVASGVEAVIVVDNCTARLHSQLAEIVGRAGSRSSLLTIDYDVGDDQPSNTLVVSLGDNSDDVLAALLEKRRPKLSVADRRHVAEFAGGNARVALKIAEGAEDGVSLASLNDTELLGRLFQSGRQDQDAHARRCAEAASLVYAFYMERGDQSDIEYPILAGVAGVSIEEFYRQIAIFLDWGIVQQRGPQRAVMPPPIANMLAAEALRRLEPCALIATFDTGPPRLFASFARRLGFLHHIPQAVTLAEALLADGQRLGQPHDLANADLTAFLNLAPAAPEAALAAIERTLAGPQRGAFLSPDRSDRREFAELLVHLAYGVDLFARAMNVLLAFVVAEPADAGNNSVRTHFLERFWIVLSFTLADLPMRAAFIDRLVDDDDERVRSVGLDALNHMVETGHFSSSLGDRFGTRPRSREWRPRGIEQTQWFRSGLDRLIRVACSNAAGANIARRIVANHTRELVNSGYADLALDAVQKISDGRYWDAGWNAVSEALSFDRTGFDTNLRAQMLALETKLRPSKPEELFEAFVLGEPWRHWHPRGREKHPVRNVAKLAQALGKCLIRRGLVTDGQIELALGVEGQTSVYDFGEGLAKAAKDIPAEWNRLLSAYRAKAGGSRNPTLLAGFLKGAARRDTAWVDDQLDAMVEDIDLRADIVFLHPSMALGSQAMRRFSHALSAGVVPAPSFQGLMYGGVTKSIPAPDLSDFLAQLYEAENGALSALKVLHMRIFGDRSDKREIAPELVVLGRAFVSNPRTYEEAHAREDYGIASIAKLALLGDGGADTAVAICRAMRGGGRSNRQHVREFDKVCALVREQYLRVVLDEIVIHPEAGDSLIGHFFGSSARDDDDRQQNVVAIDASVALQWVGEDSLVRAPRLASFIPYSVSNADTGALEWVPLARALIDTASDPIAVLNAFERRFWSGSSSGSFSSRFVRRKPLLAILADHDNRSIRNWVRQAQQRLDDDIRRWDAHDRGQESRFE